MFCLSYLIQLGIDLHELFSTLILRFYVAKFKVFFFLLRAKIRVNEISQDSLNF